MIKRNVRVLASATAVLLLGGAAVAGTSIDLNEVGALLVYSSIQASEAGGGVDDVETFVTVTNATGTATSIHMSFINGDSSSNKYCYECDFDVPVSGYDTELLVLTSNGAWTDVRNDDAYYASGSQGNRFGSRTCPWSEGMLLAWAEEAPGDPAGDNALFGDAIVVNYTDGYAYSMPAHSIQNRTGDPTDRQFDLGGNYASFPRVVAANFLAPAAAGTSSAELVLFTLDFKRQHPPEADCSIVGYDANENAFSNSIAFGCWERIDLCQDLDPEFCYPNLGLDAGGDPHTHGWLALSCEVDHDAGDNQWDWHDGNVHGALIQRSTSETVLRKNDSLAPALSNSSAWARLLFQSISQGDPGALTLESALPGPLN